MSSIPFKNVVSKENIDRYSGTVRMLMMSTSGNMTMNIERYTDPQNNFGDIGIEKIYYYNSFTTNGRCCLVRNSDADNHVTNSEHLQYKYGTLLTEQDITFGDCYRSDNLYTGNPVVRYNTNGTLRNEVEGRVSNEDFWKLNNNVWSNYFDGSGELGRSSSYMTNRCYWGFSNLRGTKPSNPDGSRQYGVGLSSHIYSYEEINPLVSNHYEYPSINFRSLLNYEVNDFVNLIVDSVTNGSKGSLFNNEVYHVGNGVPLRNSEDEWLVTPTVTYSNPHRLYPVMPFNILIVENIEDGLRYISDGTIPNNSEFYVWDGLNIPEQSSDEDDEDDDYEGDDSDTDDKDSLVNTPSSKPNHTGTESPTHKLYYMTQSEMTALFNHFWELDDVTLSDIIQYITGQTANLSQCVVSIRDFPFDISSICTITPVSNVKVGRIVWGDVNTNVIQYVNNVIDFGTVSVKKKYNSFVDYAPYTKLFIHLPYYGNLSLDTNTFMDRDISIEAAIDIMNNSIEYMIYVSSGGGKTLYTTIACEVGGEYPFTLDNATALKSGQLSKLTSITADTLSGNLIGLMENATTPVSSPSYDLKSSTTPFTSRWEFEKPYIFYVRPRYNRPKNYRKHIGFPLYKQKKLADLSGYTVCENPTIDFGTKSPTNNEVEKIYALLKEGVYL